MKLEKKLRLFYLFKFLQNAHFFSAVMVPFFTLWAGLNEQVLLLVQAVFSVAVVVLELPTGIVADKWGRRYSLMFGALAGSVGLLIYGLYANLYLFLMAEIILALAISFYSGADEAWLVDTLKQHGQENRKTEVIGKGQSAMYTGMILATLLGGFIASHISLNATMYLSSIPAVFMFLIATKLPEPKLQSDKGEVFSFKQGLMSIRVILQNPQLRRLSLNLILVAVPAYYVIWFYQPALQNLGIDVAFFGVAFSLMVGLEIVISHRFEWLEKRVGLNQYLKLSALITALGFLALAWKQNVWLVLFFMFTAGSFGLTRRYFAIGEFHKHVNSTYRASMTSSFSMLLRLTIGLTNILVGWLFVRSVPLTFLIIGLLPLIALLFFPLRPTISKSP